MYKSNLSPHEGTFYLFIDSNKDGPILLRSLYYNIRSWLVVDSTGTHSTLPGNVTVTSDPDPSISYEACINEVSHILIYFKYI